MIELIVSSVVSLLVGAGSTVLFAPQIRKSKILENEAKQAEEWRKLYEEERKRSAEEEREWREERKRLDDKIDDLYAQITKHRDEKAEKSKRIAQLEVENTRLEMLKCEVVKCINRKPPTGY